MSTNSMQAQDSSLPTEAEVVIIGGGIIGSATAYYLAKRGVDVVLLDKGAIGYEQSTRNWGWVHQQVRYPHLIPLAVESVKLWQNLNDELDADLEWVQGGNLSLGFDDADTAAFEHWAQDARDRGLETEILSRGQVSEMLPGSQGRWTNGLHVPSDGQANPDRVTDAFARAATNLGAHILTDCAALGIDSQAGAVHAVRTERGPIRATSVVCAAGAWSARFLRTLGLSLPQSAVRSTVVRTAPIAPLTDLTAWGDGYTFRQDRAGRLILASGATAIYDVTLDLLHDLRRFAPLAWSNRRWVRLHVGKPLFNDLAALIPGSAAKREFWQRRRRIDPPAHPASVRSSLAGLRAMFPALADTAIDTTWAGNIDTTPDHAPVLGSIAEAPDGFYLATGLSGHGFALGPGSGKLMSELVTGDAPSVDPHPFRFTRFAENDLPPMPELRH
ncbi:MAG TPA: FAD-dependent oxidoreductase [Dehalococcoidia bacterium]|nr:FAD-dependent oxidoreductase [Dehalococcoidia bacterium]